MDALFDDPAKVEETASGADLMTSPRSFDSAHSTTKAELILARTEQGFQVPQPEASR